jgi:uncharacterized small protein (DUF1192 family)
MTDEEKIDQQIADIQAEIQRLQDLLATLEGSRPEENSIRVDRV